jgi:hypothetical protein
LSEQATVTAEKPAQKPAEAPASAPVVTAASRPANSRKPKGAGIRIHELLGEVKTLKAEQIERERVHRAELEKLRAELLAVLAENADFRSREEQRMWQTDQDAKAAQQVADDHRLLCFRALVDVSHQVGAYQRHPDFDSKMRRAETHFSTQLLEQILMFSPQVAPEVAYALASDPKSAARVSALPLVAGVFLLCKFAEPFEDAIKLQKLIGA